MGKKPVITLYDIETTPNRSYTWDHYETNVLAYEKQWELLSFSYKRLKENRVYCKSRRLYTERELVVELHKEFDQSDFLIAHNGDSFDYKKANAKFIEFGLKPPSPSVCIDTKKLAKKYFKFNTNKLDDLCDRLELGRKVKHEGIDLWLKCMQGDKEALILMETYNKQDIVLLEKLYLKLRPWITNQPSLSVSNSRMACPNCGNYSMLRRGTRVRRCGSFQTLQCKDCGSWTSKKL